MSNFEKSVLLKLLDFDQEWFLPLRYQSVNLKVDSRNNTGYGFYLKFKEGNPKLSLGLNVDFYFGDVVASIPGLELGAGFVLFIKNGFISMLEGYSYEEMWPDNITKFELEYESGKVRNCMKFSEDILKQCPILRKSNK